MVQTTLKAAMHHQMAPKVTTILHKAIHRSTPGPLVLCHTVIIHNTFGVVSGDTEGTTFSPKEAASEVEDTSRICTGMRTAKVEQVVASLLEALHRSLALNRTLHQLPLNKRNSKVAPDKLRQKMKRMMIYSGLRKICKWRIHRRSRTTMQRCHHQVDQLLQAHNPISSALLSKRRRSRH